MIRGLRVLIAAQFLSALSDNAMLFIIVAIVLKSGTAPSWYIPALQAVFLIAFVSLAPWVGPCADRFPKSRVLIAANLTKAVGVGLIMAGLEPLLGYTIVGVGAALYSPAKYGILPELAEEDRLVHANGWVEGATIGAILIGTLAGAKLADRSIDLALAAATLCYVLSALASAFLPPIAPRGADLAGVLRRLSGRTAQWLRPTSARLVLGALSLFWATAATLRIALVAWAPSVLGTGSAGEIAELTLFLALGIVAGSLSASRVIPLHRTRRAALPAFAIAVLLVILADTARLWPARSILFGIGLAGGMLVVPLNATMQRFGHISIGSGAAVALQNLFQNLAMLVAVGTYTLSTASGGSAADVIRSLAVLLLAAGTMIAWRPATGAPSDP
ncbi:MAG: lysophospholipid transporter LplT [Methylotetracoccus sp.]